MSHNIYSTLRDRVIAALRGVVPDLPDEVIARVEVTPAKDPAHGDMATNAAMVVAKAAGMKPAEIAARLVAVLAGDVNVAAAAVAGPGFVNLTLEPAVWLLSAPRCLPWERYLQATHRSPHTDGARGRRAPKGSYRTRVDTPQGCE